MARLPVKTVIVGFWPVRGRELIIIDPIASREICCPRELNPVPQKKKKKKKGGEEEEKGRRKKRKKKVEERRGTVLLR